MNKLSKITTVALDLDATLLNNQKYIDSYTRTILATLKNKYHIILCSGRSPFSTRYIADTLRLNEPVISFNGAVTINEQAEIIEAIYLSKVATESIIPISKKFSLEILLYDEERMYLGDDTDLNLRWQSDILPLYKYNIGDKQLYDKYKQLSLINRQQDLFAVSKQLNITKLVILPSNSNFENMVKFMRDNSERLGVSINITPRYIEITPSIIDKSVALEKVLKERNESFKNVLSIGDNMNDYPLLSKSQVSIAMENGLKYIKESASYVTTDNNHSGVGNALSKFLIEEES